MPDLVSLVVALVMFLRRGLRAGESTFEGVSRQWIERRFTALWCEVLRQFDLGPEVRGLASLESPELDDALPAALRARLGALAPEERRLAVYRLVRALAVDAAPPGSVIEWDESVALYFGSGEKAEVWGLTSYRPSPLAMKLLGASDVETWAAVAVGLVAAAFPRMALSILRGRAHAEGCASRIPQWARERLSAVAGAQRAEEALSFVLDVLCFDVWAHRRALDRAIVRGGTEPFFQYLRGVVAQLQPESPRERTMQEVCRELERLSAPFERFAFFVSETEGDSRVTPLAREEMIAWIAKEIASPEHCDHVREGLRNIARDIDRHPSSVAILVQCSDPDAVDLVLIKVEAEAQLEPATNAPGGVA